MKTLLAGLSLLLFTLPAAAQDKITIDVTGGKSDQQNVVIRAASPALKVGVNMAPVFESDKMIAVGQVVPVGEKSRELVFVLPDLKAGAKRTFTINTSAGVKLSGPSFKWVEKTPGQEDLVLDPGMGKADRPVLRYMHTAFDDSSKEKRDRSYKVFHHLYDPDGKRFVTNGGHTDPHTDAKKLLFPHHRGLMFAFNRISYDGKKADTWHATGDAHQTHEKTLREVAGPVLASQTVQVDWHGVKKEVFATEERTLTAYNVPGGTLIDTDIVLKTTGGKIRLDGDPQHAGFQFRASNDVVTQGNAKQTYYLRPDGKGKPGETRNWEPKSKKGPVDLPWNVVSFVLDGQRYSVALIDHPENPGERRHSERDYGRFGSYFEYDLTKEHPLHLRHRVWLQKGEMTVDQVEALREAFVAPPKIAVK